MIRTIAAALIALCPLAGPALAQKPADYAAAVAAPGRPPEAVALDAGRKPAEVLAFLGLRKGMVAADIMADSGYYTELMARVVGPKGKVVAFEPSQFVDEKLKAKLDGVLARTGNASTLMHPFEGFAAPAGQTFDFVLMHLVYHDLYWESEKYKVPRVDPAKDLAQVFAMVKPGGIVAVVDHVGPAGDTRTTVDKLHRIDPEVVKADFKAAGFVLEAESDLLRVAGDDHAKIVFDPSVRGKTDRFVFRFRKPR